MTKPRSQQISLEATPYYHVTSRCVRRAFLCGIDQIFGKNYEHRREWISQRLAELERVFCIDINAYAIMSNHYHLVVYINKNIAISLTDDEVIERWQQLYQLPLLVQRQRKGERLTKAEKEVINSLVIDWRERLYDLSWFMRCLNEPIARQANEEDKCTGRFWEGRYKSQALLDDAALLTCMSYVDLNPIRAKMADSPEASDYTSIQSRIQFGKKKQNSCSPIKLRSFIGNEHQSKSIEKGICFSFVDYLQLVDTAGRAIVENKRGYISAELSPVLERIGIEPENWLDNVTKLEQRFFRAVGAVEKLKDIATHLKQSWIKGASASRQLYKTQPG
ncbi:transposase [Pseudomonadota bacterium]